MIPVLFVLVVIWAGSGAVASIKAASAGEPTAAAPSSKKGAAAPAAGTPDANADGRNRADITFGQWQRAAYGRWKNKIRAATFGKARGSKAADVIGDGLAAVLAGAGVFGLGFASGTAWAGAKWSQRSARQRLKQQPGTGRKAAGRRSKPAPGFTPPPAPNLGPQTGSGNTAPRPGTTPPPGNPSSGVVDAELIDDPNPQPAMPSAFANAEDAEIVLPQLLSSRPDAPNGTSMATEILTIHHLFAWAKAVIAHTVNTVEAALVRARTAAERAAMALARSGAAVARADSAAVAAGKAHAYAVQLEQTAARFQVLRMDNASLASIGAAITAAVNFGQLAQRRAEAEAFVAAKSAELAAAEEAASAAAAAEAAGAQHLAEAVQNMHDTVQAHQMPHAEAQAVTGNAAAHSSVLAAG